MANKKHSVTALAPVEEIDGQLVLKLNDGHKMPMVGLGTWQSTPDVVREAVRNAVKSGYRLIDTAFWYSNEEAIGDELQALFKEGVVKREDLFITTKLHPSYMGRDQVVDALKLSLKALKLDYVDLFLIHWPFTYKSQADPKKNFFPVDDQGVMMFDYTKHYTKTWGGMEECKYQGLAKSIGVSNFNIHQLENLLFRATIKPAILQVESHPYMANSELIEFAQSRGISMTAYSSFANPGNGLAPTESDKYPKPLQAEDVKAIAAKYPGKTPGHVLLRWQLQRGVAVIPRSVSAERQKQNLNVFDFSLTPDDVATLDAMDKGLRMCAFGMFRQSSSRDYPFDEYRDIEDSFK